MKLEGKVALITGGGAGIGAAIAKRFVTEGARVCISGRRQEALEKTAYCASKAGLIMLTQQAALDYGPQRIRVNAVCPGAIKTEMVEKEFGQIGRMIGMEPPDFFSMVSKVLPLQRFGDPQEIGGICAFLASDDSSFMTGSAIVIDAGTAVVDALGAEMMGSVRRYFEQQQSK